MRVNSKNENYQKLWIMKLYIHFILFLLKVRRN